MLKTRNRRGTRKYGFERLEERRVMAAINWTNEFVDHGEHDNGLDQLSPLHELAARVQVHRAIDAWENVIESFNYSVGSDEYDLTFQLTPGGGSGGGRPVSIDADGKPHGGSVSLPGQGLGGVDWYFGPPDDSAFTELKTPFAAFGADVQENDFYLAMLHEVGHALGIGSTSYACIVNPGMDGCLAIHDHFELPTFLIDDDPVQANPLNMLYDFVVDGEVVATFTNAGDGTENPQTIQDMSPAHVYEGHVDDWQGRVSHPYDLMNDGRSITWAESAGALTESHQFQRRLISDIDATILAEGYGYTVNMPSHIDTMHATLQYSTDSLIVRGIEGEVDNIRIDMHGGQIRVRVNDTIELFDPDDVSQIIVHAGNEDSTTLESLELADIDHVQVNGFGTLVLDASSEASGATWNITADTFTRTGWSYDVTGQYSEFALAAGHGNNLIDVAETFPNRDYYFIGGNANDQFRFQNLDFHRGDVAIDGNGGTDTVRLYEPDNSSSETYLIDGYTVSRSNDNALQGYFVVEHQDVENVYIDAGKAGDAFNVLSTLDGVYTAIMTGEQPDPSETIVIGNPPPAGPDMVNIGDGNYGHNIKGHVHVVGQGNADQVIVDDRPGMLGGVANPGGDDDTRFHEINSSNYNHSETEAYVFYSSIEQFRLEASSGADTVNVQSTHESTKTTVSTGGGDDLVVLALDSQNLNSVAGPVSVEGGASNHTAVYLYDTSAGGIITYDVEEYSVERAGFGGLEYDQLQLLQLEGGPAFAAYYNLHGSNATTTAVWGHGGFDRFTIHDSSFDQLILRGGSGSDTVYLDGLESATILPNPMQLGTGIMLIDEAVVHYHEMERLQADEIDSLEYVTPNSADVLQLTEQSGTWHELNGTSGDLDLVPLWFRNIADLHLNLAQNDQRDGDDWLAVLAGDLPAQGVDEVRVSSGTGENLIDVRKGTLRLHASEGGYGVNTDVSVFNESSLVQFGKSQNLRSLEVRNGGEVELIAGPREMYLESASLDVGPVGSPDGTIQLHNHGLIINYVGASPLQTIVQAIEHARVENAPIYWTGTGVTSSLAANSPHDFEVVAEEAVDVLADGNGKFHGAKLLNEETAVLVEAVTTYDAPLLPGDYNLNGVVDAADSTVWRDTLGTNVTPFSGADGNGDGLVSFLDYQVWKENFGATLPSLALSSALPSPNNDPISERTRAAVFAALDEGISKHARSRRFSDWSPYHISSYLSWLD